jgi:hypothetical protein
MVGPNLPGVCFRSWFCFSIALRVGFALVSLLGGMLSKSTSRSSKTGPLSALAACIPDPIVDS